MKAKQFRIGNYYNHNGEVKEITVNTLSNLFESEDRAWFEPIPLSEEWLLKFGFKCVHIKNIHYTVNDPNGVAELHKISIFPTVNNQWHIAFSDELNGYKDYIPTTKISHVHQLQNLYFALTGEELTIKK